MDTTEFIARIIGPIYIVVSIGIVACADTYRKMILEYLESPALCYLGGFLALIFGLLILNFYHAWRADWTVIITIIGWLGAIKGALLIIYPKAVLGYSKKLISSTSGMRAMGVGALLFGLYLSGKGYGLI